MARERWFFARGSQKRGPVPFDRLVESVLGQPDPRAVLVWRKGLAEWMRGEDVPEVERRLAPLLAGRVAEEAARQPPAAAPVAVASQPVRLEDARPGSPALVYGGITGGVVLLVLVGWLFWPRPRQPAPGPVPLGGMTPENAPAVVITPAPAAAPATPIPTPPPVTTRTSSPAAPAAGLDDRETNLPLAELRKLRSVWAWEGEALTGTVYNGTGWRVTEVYVRIGRFVNEDFVEDPQPLLLVPPEARVDAGVADLLSRVAPDRKKPGLNPHDTGAFGGKAGARPESFRAEIEIARGYAPR
jgi:hypothetical protein